MLKAFFLISFFILLSNLVSAQAVESLSRNISVSLGATHYRLIDEAFSHERIKYTGTAFSLELSHQRFTNRYFFSGGLHVSVADLSTNKQRPGIEFINLQINAAYARHFLNYQGLGMSSQVYLGGQVSSTNYLLANSDVLEQFTITSCHCLNLFIFQRTEISSRSHLEFSASFPFVGFIKRSVYDDGWNQSLKEGYNNSSVVNLLYQGAEFSVLNPLSFPKLSVSFIHGITPKTDFIAKYQFHYARDSSIAPIKLYSNILSVGLRFNFNKEK